MEQKLTPQNKWNKELHGENIYNPNIKELVGFQMTCLEKMYDYNQTRPSQMEKRAELIKEMFAEAGEGCYIEPPFYANWGGRHVHLGNHVYANFGLTCVDDTHIYIGDHTIIGAGSVVTKDIPANCLAVGNPCRVLRELNEHDREYYYRDRKIDWDTLK